jgi:hypothetical protein
VPIQGSLAEADLPDVLQLLALGHKTGCLTLTDGATQGQVYLDAGRISYASVAGRLDRLGDILVKNGRITQQHLQEAIAEQARRSDWQLGRILVEAGRIERTELERFVRFQVEEAVYLLFTWKRGTFTFTSDRSPPNQSLLVSLDAESLLLEGARRVDEWSRIQKKIPSLDVVFRRVKVKHSAAASELTDAQQRILPLLDGSRDVAAVVDSTGMSEFDVGKALFGLATAGFVQLVERRTHVRHLEYRELLAYAVREAEFADGERRKEAARHIVDCAICGARLRMISDRRMTGATPFTPPVALEEARGDERTEGAAAPARSRVSRTSGATEGAATATRQPLTLRGGSAAPAPRVQGATESRGHVERRVGDRRTGRDRRQTDRRSGVDRRRTLDPAWAAQHVERRVTPRRSVDRGGRVVRDRRSGESVSRAAAAPSAAPDVRPAGPERRSTAALRLERPERRASEPPTRVPRADDGSADGENAPAAASEVAATTAGEVAPAADAGPAAAGPAPDAVDASPAADEVQPIPTGARSRSKEIDWLVTPEESLEMIRGSRRTLRRKPEAQSVSVSEPAAPPLDLTDSARVEPRQGGGGKGVGRKAGRRAVPVRSLAVVAALAVVALVGYVAGRVGKRAPSVPTPETASAGAVAPAAVSPPPVQAHGVEPSPRGEEAPAPVAGGEAERAERDAARQPVALAAAERPGRPTPEPRTPPPPGASGAVPAPQPPVAAAPAAPGVTAVAPAPQRAPTVGVVRGVVRGVGGQPLAGARVSVRGTALSSVADGQGAFVIDSVPEGPATLQASAEGYLGSAAQVVARAGATVASDLTLSRVPTAAEPDRELTAGGWAQVERAEAVSVLGGTLGVIAGLPVESVARSTAGARPRIRVAQIAASGERIVLTETRAGADVRAEPGSAVVTALRVMAASEAYPWSTGTVSFGSVLITAKTRLAADSLRAMLSRMSELQAGRP